jgi:A/G-specific adenine glycosylase
MDVDALERWYERVKRPLPWRATRDPYALLVSEVMLQQTQAVRVVPYYERFLAAFPDVVALASAEPAAVLREWSGLGYNRRALALRSAARQVAARGWPADLEELPGVGPYTAAAVASFAWDAPMAAVDTNVRRLLRRHDGLERTPRALAERARELLPTTGPPPSTRPRWSSARPSAARTARTAAAARSPTAAPGTGPIRLPPAARGCASRTRTAGCVAGSSRCG